MQFTCWVALAFLPLSSVAWTAAPASTRIRLPLHSSSSSRPFSGRRLRQTNSSLSSEDLEEQRQLAQDTIDQISDLKNVLLEDFEASQLDNYQSQVDELESWVILLESTIVPPSGLTADEFQSTLAVFLQLPFPIRCAFCEALELENPGEAASDLQRIPEIVTLLYQQRIQLTPQRLQDALKKVQSKLKSMPQVVTIGEIPDAIANAETTTSTTTTNTGSKNQGSDITNSILRGWLFDESAANKTDEELQSENTVKNILGRVTRKEGIEATKADLDRVLKVLDKDIFVVSGTEAIPGGYIIRGKNAKKTGADLIAAVDQKLPKDFPAQLSLMSDITNTDIVAAEMVGENPDPILVLLNKDFSPQASGVLTFLSSTIAVMAAFVFCVSVYGQNDIVANRLSEATAVSDADGLSWFTSRVYDCLVPILAIQGLHEMAHFVASKARNFEAATPTLIPFYGLPFMGTKTDLVSSPPNRNALFDFAAAGPVVGLVAAFACFAYGLELTATADVAMAQFFPSLPVSLISKSTLGGSMIDYVLGGGMSGYENRFITMQDGSEPVPLHPLAVAGFTSLVINAISLLPLGSTDGGRLSQTLFGRFGHITISSFIWLALLATTFTVKNSDILIGAWAINNVIQNDCEVPCRDETEDVSFPRIIAAIGLWVATVLTLTPL